MIKFKRVNIVNLAKRCNVNYYLLDIIRQTSIERVVDFVNSEYVGTNKEQFINIMLSYAKIVFNKIIKEDNKK